MRKLFLFLIFTPLLSFSQMQNAGFEIWNDTSGSPYELDLTGLGLLEPISGVPDGWSKDHFFLGVDRISNAYSGNYAVLVYTWYHYAPAQLMQSIISINRPDSLTGYYMYLPNKADTNLSERYVRVSVMKNGDTIGTGFLQFDSTDNYMPFTVPLQYTGSQLPDSSIIEVFSAGESAGALLPPANNLIILDELQLHTTVTGLEKMPGIPDVSIYPNPVTDFLHIQTTSSSALDYEILGLDGRVIVSSRLKDNLRIPLNQLIPGNYLLLLRGPDGNIIVLQFSKID